jgi:hypothetical protein
VGLVSNETISPPWQQNPADFKNAAVNERESNKRV